jgi:hypothetical protein
LVQDLRQSNANMRVVRRHENINLNGARADPQVWNFPA